MQNIYKEEWRDIAGYEGRYQVSNLGNVRNLHYNSKTLTTKDNGVRNLVKILKGTGYYVVSLHKSGKQKQCHIHRLVAEAFLPNPNCLPVIDHINTVTTDNRVENLRWVTIKQNVNNPISAKRRKESIQKRFKGKCGVNSYSRFRGVAQYTKDGQLVKVWGCMADAWRSCGIDSGGLTRACQGKQKSAGGYVWKYTNEHINNDYKR